MNEQEVAEKIHASMLEYLGSKRYPNMTHDQIIAECPNMWRKLEEERLIVSGMSYKQFITHAKKQKMVTQYAESASLSDGNGVKMGRVLAERTHCYRGHAWTEDNTVWVKDKRKPTGKRRQCRACKNTIHRVWSRANSFKKRGEKVPDGLLESIFQEGVRRPDKTKIIQIRAHLAHSTDHLNKAFKLLSEVEKRAT